MSIYNKLFQMQQEFKAAKTGYNKFGGFNYRNFEQMMDVLKPILAKHKCIILVDNTPQDTSNGVYINTKVTLLDIEDSSEISSTSTVRDGDNRERKELCNAQISGAAQSYNAKYALGFLLGVAAEKDPDSYEPTNKTAPKKNMTKDGKINSMICEINTCTSIDELQQKWTQFGKWTEDKQIKDAFTARKKQIINP